MDSLKVMMASFDTMQRRIIALALGFIPTFMGIFFGMINIDKDFSSFSALAGKSLAKILQDNSMSFLDLLRISIDQDEMGSAFVVGVIILLFVAAYVITVISVLAGNKYGPIGQIAVASLTLLYSIAYLIEVNSMIDVFSFSFSRILVLLFSILTAGFWYIAVETEETEDAGVAQAKAKEELGKVMNNVKSKAEEVKRNNSCPHCGKILTPKSAFCNGCGKPVQR